jgi:hypothetical protein
MPTIETADGRAPIEFDALSPGERSQVEQVLEQCDLARLTRGIRREGTLEVWD